MLGLPVESPGLQAGKCCSRWEPMGPTLGEEVAVGAPAVRGSVTGRQFPKMAITFSRSLLREGSP